MEIKMPYGKVVITTKEEAVYFLTHMCWDCPKAGLWNPCSGHQASCCEEKKKQVIEYIQKIDNF
ncbi:MAG: hypothetical protein IKB70_07890 [Bacilli bacterium]|nr:hypothetical protein [Bacilli bacterium]